METKSKKAIDPGTRDEYQIEMPAPAVVKQAILELPWPPDGRMPMETSKSKILAEKLKLSEDQKNAVYESGGSIFWYVVDQAFRELVKDGKLEQRRGPRTPYFLVDEPSMPMFTKIAVNPDTGDEPSMPMVTKTAVDSDGQEYEIEVPATSVVKEALLNFNYSPEGIRIQAAADRLASQFKLTDEEINTRNKYGRIFHRHVNIAANSLVNSGKLTRIKIGWISKPIPPKPPEPLPPRVIIEENHQKLRDELANELLQQISAKSPAFFEKLVLDLLVKIGYGGSCAKAKAGGRSGDGGIDGIIYGGRPWLDTIYVQVKRWKKNVGRPDIQKFAGALQGKSARKGIFVTTSKFSKPAREFVDTIDPKVILIDGAELVKIMINHDFGDSTAKNDEIKGMDSDDFA